ncbi:hypothetical protein [Opitutus sp. ER46]|uniref:hypothetical protein n=1 Tax=Opitutus sp. ER46 TaxID=2161864 RepID=UPI000D3090D1|nr:hypothetical protein [Opitutus sp. ER46]PTY00384.1 hypothetical protein DB354_01885 [Opitutus sp. ER46]
MRRSTATFPCLLLLLAAVLSANVTAFAETASSSAPAPSPSPLRWLRCSTPEFTLITDLDSTAATARAKEFSQYIAALRGYFGNPTAPLLPLTLVVFRSHADFDRFRPLDAQGRPQLVGGFFVRNEAWAILGAPGDATAETTRTLYHEGVHWFMHSAERTLPPWLDEGMAEVFSTFELVGSDVRWGRELRGRVQLLHRYHVLPLKQLLFTSRADLFGRDATATDVFYAQSWAFVHFLMFGENKSPHDAATHYVALLERGTDPDAAFTQAFGHSYEAMDRLLQRYLQGQGGYRTYRQPLAPTVPVRPVPATPDDVDDALGRLALVGARLVPASARARAIIARGLAPARGHTLLALTYRAARQPAEAAAEFERAARAGSTDFETYFEAGCALQGASAGIATVTSDTARQAADYYEQAIKLNAGYEKAYANLAGLMGLAEPLLPADHAALTDGARRFPGNLLIPLGLAQLSWRRGEKPAARRLLDGVLAQADRLNAQTAAYAERIRAAWTDEERMATIATLARERKYADALARVDEWLDTVSDRTTEAELLRWRRDLTRAAGVSKP